MVQRMVKIIIEQLAGTKYESFLDENKLIYSSQHGLTNRKSCLTKLIEFSIGFLNTMIKMNHLILYNRF